MAPSRDAAWVTIPNSAEFAQRIARRSPLPNPSSSSSPATTAISRLSSRQVQRASPTTTASRSPTRRALLSAIPPIVGTGDLPGLKHWFASLGRRLDAFGEIFRCTQPGLFGALVFGCAHDLLCQIATERLSDAAHRQWSRACHFLRQIYRTGPNGLRVHKPVNQADSFGLQPTDSAAGHQQLRSAP